MEDCGLASPGAGGKGWKNLLREKQTATVNGEWAGAMWNVPCDALRRTRLRCIISLKTLQGIFVKSMKPFRMIVPFTLQHPRSVRHKKQDFRRSAWHDASG